MNHQRTDARAENDSDAPQDAAATRLYGVQSLDRAIAILRLLAEHQTCGLALSSIVAKTGLDRTTAYRIASALVDSGLASRDLQKKYRLGLETMVLGLASMQRPPLIELCTPTMKALARQSECDVLLAVQSGDYSHCLHMEASSAHTPDFQSYVGRVRLLGTGISGIALLARFTDPQVHEHYARHKTEYQEYGMTEIKLHRMLVQTRSADFTYVNLRGIAGVGICFNMGSCGLAGLNVASRASDLPRSRAPAIAAMMREHLDRLCL